jgi:metal-responsive CopG/Arc/MetJ family transcriptional regulator
MKKAGRSKSKRRTGTVRRSFALPYRLLEEVIRVAPPEGPDNLNALVREALEEYVVRRRDEAFAEEMARMAKDPQVRRESKRIDEEFRAAEGDGL